MVEHLKDPIFDSVRKALVFALNAHHQVEMPRPFMNKAMAEAPAKKVSKASMKVLAAAGALPEQATKCSSGPKRDVLKGMDRAAQAGFILQQFNRLDHHHQVVLEGLLITPANPCACRRPCCSGMATNLRWSKAVTDMCEILMNEADVAKVPGKKGLSTQPGLRKDVVCQYFTGIETTLTELAASAEVSTITAAKHKAWITDYLLSTETEAWLQIQDIFDQSGITGFLG